MNRQQVYINPGGSEVRVFGRGVYPEATKGSLTRSVLFEQNDNWGGLRQAQPAGN